MNDATIPRNSMACSRNPFAKPMAVPIRSTPTSTTFVTKTTSMATSTLTAHNFLDHGGHGRAVRAASDRRHDRLHHPAKILHALSSRFLYLLLDEPLQLVLF